MRNFLIKQKISFYLIPFFVNLAIGIISISTPLLVIKLGANALTLGGLGSINGLFFSIFSLPFGKLSDHLGHKYVIAGAMFWPSLEAWTAEREDNEPLTKKVSLFSVSWCTGLTVGLSIGGAIFQLNSHLPFYLASFLFCLSMSFLILNDLLDDKSKNSCVLKETLFKEDLPPDVNPPSKEMAFSYLYAAWVANFVSCFSVGMIRYLFPKLSTQLNIEPFILGILLASSNLSEVLVFYILGRVNFWRYRWLPLFFLQLLEIIGLITIFLTNSVIVFLFAFILVGAGTGMGYFSGLFYGLNDHQDRGAKSGVNEALFGGGMVFGPLVGGIFAQVYTLRTPYLVAIFVIAVGIITEFLLIKKEGQL